MDDLISRQALFDALRARFGVDFDYGKWWSSTHVLAALESVPPVTQEPCEDAISRRAVIDAMSDTWKHICFVARRRKPTKGEEAVYYDMVGTVKNMPSVKPQYTDAEIQKMQELEQAEIEKAYELGKEAAKVQKTGRWEEVQFRTIPYNRISKARKCSVCGKRKDKYVIWNYCPNCGCRMVEPKERSGNA